MARFTVNEAVMLRHKTSDFRQVFVPGQEVPSEWEVPEEYAVALPEVPSAADGDAEDDDDDPDGDDEEPASEGAGDEEHHPDGAFLQLDLDVAASSVAAIEAAVLAVPETLRDEAARWVLSEESIRPGPRKTLLDKMRALLP